MEFDLFVESICKSVSQIHGDMEALYANQNINELQTLDHLNREIMILEGKLQRFRESNQQKTEEIHAFQSVNNSWKGNEVNTRAITREELAMSDGRNGNPAYVAVNGFVYDVTNNPTWAAGTHFGLSAGHDVTEEFAACHAGQNILDKLPVVGFLA
ncbi:cytochrome b5-like heme/steroid binding domain protein [Anaerotignum neopropionicum]|uniref:Cytochrome b5-like heme/steroid binding domain protein n=1 Tax=Anaerotignum neopropionicum TaxID=36847 RepID=A0A136WD65_9FIRM|nr:cytochrome b5 domain-containing protein [Anaerotignum neopropionicum]KXL52441.1 cytochrome b5-like heme/steroid binding domain protein [Anaerotignum neopropionicum]